MQNPVSKERQRIFCCLEEEEKMDKRIVVQFLQRGTRIEEKEAGSNTDAAASYLVDICHWTCVCNRHQCHMSRLSPTRLIAQRARDRKGAVLCYFFCNSKWGLLISGWSDLTRFGLTQTRATFKTLVTTSFLNVGILSPQLERCVYAFSVV